MAELQTKDIETLAYVVHNPKEDFVLEDVVLDEMRDDEVLVDMKFSGICHTVSASHQSILLVAHAILQDIVFQQGEIQICPYPAIFGHEGAGTIRAIGSKIRNKDLKVGDFVLLSINYCEECKQCRTGHPADCIHGTRLHLHGVRPTDQSTAAKLKKDGNSVRAHFFGQSSFMKTSYVQETSIVKFDGEPEEAAKFAAMGCGYQTGAGTVLNILQPKPSQSVVIFGLGTVGLTALMACRYIGVRNIIAVDIQPSKFDLAKELGATHIVNSREISDVPAHIKQLTGDGADFCIDCTGVPAVIETMLNSLAMLGTAVQVGVAPADAKIPISPLKFLLESKRYIGCREGDSVPREFVPRLVKMHREGYFPVEKLVKVYDYKDFDKAMDDLHHGRVIKPVIQWS